MLLDILKNNRVNRLSIGIESFNKEKLEFMNRNHTFNDAEEKIKLARKKGFDNINVDLIYGIPGETLHDLRKDIDLLLKLKPDHISTYSLIVEDNTKIGISGVVPIKEELDASMYEEVCNTLDKKNYEHYEVSNFAKKGKESKHNINYWHNNEYYGFGLGASGYINNVHYDNTKSLNNYIKGNHMLSKEELNEQDIMSYHLILGFRLINGINKKDFYNKYHIELIDMYNIKSLIKEGYLIDDGENIKIKYDMIYVENKILENFI